MFDNLYEDEIAMIIDQSINSNQFADSPPRMITNELLSSICEVLVQKASRGKGLFGLFFVLVFINL